MQGNAILAGSIKPPTRNPSPPPPRSQGQPSIQQITENQTVPMCLCKGYWGCSTKQNHLAWCIYGFLTSTGLVMLIMGASKLPACSLQAASNQGSCHFSSKFMMYTGVSLLGLGQLVLLYFCSQSRPVSSGKLDQVGWAGVCTRGHTPTGAARRCGTAVGTRNTPQYHP